MIGDPNRASRFLLNTSSGDDDTVQYAAATSAPGEQERRALIEKDLGSAVPGPNCGDGGSAVLCQNRGNVSSTHTRGGATSHHKRRGTRPYACRFRGTLSEPRGRYTAPKFRFPPPDQHHMWCGRCSACQRWSRRRNVHAATWATSAHS